MYQDEEEAKLSVGHCRVRGASSGELKERNLYSRWKAEEWDDKIAKARSPQRKDELLKAKARAIRKVYFKNLSELILHHDFPISNGEAIDEYLASLSEDDIEKVEMAINAASSLSDEEAKDLSPPPETEPPQSTRETPP